MKKGFFLLQCFLLNFSVHIAYADAPLPHLTDIVIEGSVDAPVISQTELQFEVGLPYILVITNDKPVAVSLYYGKFGQKVSTQYLQGTSGLTQESLVLNPNSKLQWYFIPQEEGEFPFYATNNGFNLHKKEGKIVVKKPVEEKPPQATVSAQTETQNPSEEKSKAPIRKSGGRRG